MGPRQTETDVLAAAALVTVSGGIAYTFTTPRVQLVVVDWDNFSSPTSHEDYTTEDIQGLINQVTALPKGVAPRDVIPDLEQIREELRQKRRSASLSE